MFKFHFHGSTVLVLVQIVEVHSSVPSFLTRKIGTGENVVNSVEASKVEAVTN